jgi:CBS domain-containing protein
MPTVGSVATRTNAVLHPDHPLDKALKRVRRGRSTFIPVADGVQIVGVFEVDRLARYPRKTAHDRQRLTVRDRMTTTVPFLFEADPLPLGAAIAGRTGATHFCVIDRRHRLIGTVSFHGKDAVAEPDTQADVNSATVRRRFVKEPARAAATTTGDVGSYADSPVLYL